MNAAESLTKAQLLARIAELEAQVAEQEANGAAPAETPRRPGETKFIQITAGQPYGQGLTLFGLDEDGNVWQTIIGREPWALLPRPGSPESL
jgi:hypothetical protein